MTAFAFLPKSNIPEEMGMIGNVTCDAKGRLWFTPSKEVLQKGGQIVEVEIIKT